MSGAPAVPPAPAPHPMEAPLVAALRRYGAVNAALMRGFAGHLALHPTDAAALTEILTAEDAARPLTPATLAAALGLSRPAVSAVLKRLEGAGLVRRRPDAADRRRVHLLAAEGVGAETGRFFAPQSRALAEALAAFDTAQTALMVAMLDRVSDGLSATLENSSLEPSSIDYSSSVE